MNEDITPWQQIRTTLALNDADALMALLTEWSSVDLGRAMSRLDEPERVEIMRLLPSDVAAQLLESLPSTYTTEVIEHLVAEDATSIVAQFPTDEQADLLTDISSAERDAILERLDPATAAETSQLLQYPADTAGALMTLNYLRYAVDSPCIDVLHRITEAPSELSRYVLQSVYVADTAGRLWGSVRTRHLVDAPAHSTLNDLVRVCAAINVNAKLETLNAAFDETADLALPITADDGTLLGVLTRDRVEEAQADRLAAEHLRSQGILTEELRSMPVVQRARRRLSWLSVNIVLNMLAASIIAAFEATLTSVIALAVFLPIVSDMSGCSGNQAVAVSMRELTLGVVRPRDVLHVWWQEAKVGVLNGLALGGLLALAAFLWKGSYMLGVVVGVALSVNTLIAVSIGGCVPLILKRLKVDPAVASGPVLTTVTDMCGFFLVLGLATLALPWL